MPKDFEEAEPGLRSKRPVMRLTHNDRRAITCHYTLSLISADGERLVYFEYSRARVDRRPETL